MKKLIEDEKFTSLFSPPNVGDLVKGKVIDKQKSALFVDLGIFGTGMISGKEFAHARKAFKNIDLASEISAKIVDIDNEQGFVELSMAEAQNEIIWSELREKKQNGEYITVTIEKANRGGLMTTVKGIQAFLPVSQLKPEHYPKVEDANQAKILQKLQEFIGQELKVSLLTLNSKENTIVLSEKEADMEKMKALLEKYKIGDIVKGEVTSIVDFGVFIKFIDSPDIEGLIHISELDWQLIQNPSEIVKPEEKVEAKIIDISNGRVSLSIKALKKDPWENIEKKFKKDDIVKGKVTRFNSFGAFVEIAPKIQGLIHISEFKNEEKMRESLDPKKEYKFEITLIEPESHRMILKLKNNEEKEK